MYAILLQANHDFEAALNELDTALANNPGNGQAWLTRASIHRVRGELVQARGDCHRLATLRQARVAQICLAEIAGLNGRAEQASRLLERLSAETPETDGDHLWIEGLLAELAERRGDVSAAERHYHAALLATDTPTMFLLTSYADFLIDQGRFHDVIALLTPHRGADGALLRLALAERASGDSRTQTDIDSLRERFTDSRRSGRSLHLREEARLALSLLDDPQTALPLAVANWAEQREPVDARLLLETALAAGQPQAAGAVLAWLETTGMEDVRLHALKEALHE